MLIPPLGPFSFKNDVISSHRSTDLTHEIWRFLVNIFLGSNILKLFRKPKEIWVAGCLMNKTSIKQLLIIPEFVHNHNCQHTDPPSQLYRPLLSTGNLKCCSWNTELGKKHFLARNLCIFNFENLAFLIKTITFPKVKNWDILALKILDLYLI